MGETRFAAPVAAAAVLLATLTGCSGQQEGCLDVPAAIMTSIADGANDQPIEPVDAAAFQTEAGNYMVAMSFTAAGVPAEDPAVGVWLVTSLEDPAGAIAVGAMAASFTDWPNEVNGTEFTITTPGAQEAERCLDQKG